MACIGKISDTYKLTCQASCLGHHLNPSSPSLRSTFAHSNTNPPPTPFTLLFMNKVFVRVFRLGQYVDWTLGLAYGMEVLDCQATCVGLTLLLSHHYTLYLIWSPYTFLEALWCYLFSQPSPLVGMSKHGQVSLDFIHLSSYYLTPFSFFWK